MPTNNYAQNENATQAPATNAFAVTPHDSTELTFTTRALYVGGAGNVVVRLSGDAANVTLVGVVAGTILPIRVILVPATGTTATNIIGLY
jgi:hypothetical protein